MLPTDVKAVYFCPKVLQINKQICKDSDGPPVTFHKCRANLVLTYLPMLSIISVCAFSAQTLCCTVGWFVFWFSSVIAPWHPVCRARRGRAPGYSICCLLPMAFPAASPTPMNYNPFSILWFSALQYEFHFIARSLQRFAAQRERK